MGRIVTIANPEAEMLSVPVMEAPKEVVISPISVVDNAIIRVEPAPHVIIQEKIVQVPVEVIKEVEVIREVKVEVPVEVIREVEVIVEKRVEIPVEVIKEVQTTKVLEIPKVSVREVLPKWAMLAMACEALVIIAMLIK